MPALSLPVIALSQQSRLKPAPGTLLDALHRRKDSTRFSDRAIEGRQLSQLLWAAFGINGTDGRRTVPALGDNYNLRIFVLFADGVYIYSPVCNSLDMIVAADKRNLLRLEGVDIKAPLVIAIYADLKKHYIDVNAERQMSMLAAGAAVQNMGLYCASEGMNIKQSLDFDDHTFRILTGLTSGCVFMTSLAAGYAD